MQYQLVTSTILSYDPIGELKKRVNKFLKLGWRPQGGPIVVGDTIVQAITLEK